MAEREGLLIASRLRPFGAALRALSPLRCPRRCLIQTVENLPHVWRRGRDCSALRASSLRSASGPPSLALRRLPLPPSTDQIPQPFTPRPSVRRFLTCWRRGRDSNPRRAFDPYALSRGAPSTTRPPLPSG